MLRLELGSGEVSEVEAGTDVYSYLNSLGDEAKKDAIGIKLGSRLLDMQTPITESGPVEIVRLKEDTPATRLFYRHSMSHVLAQAVKRLYPSAKLAIGPAIAEGFYYDFEVETPFTPEDLEKISKEMKKVIKEKHRFERMQLPIDEARSLIEELGEPYKLELLEDISDRGEDISFYKDGEFCDLCAGPHIRFTNQIKHFKLLEVAGAYWKGNEANKMLQRIYGTAFLSKEDLEQHLWQLEEAKKRDHRRLGKELDLFSSRPDTVGGGLILWHPKGGLVRHLIEEHCKEKHLKGGYDFVYTPHVGKAELWKTSGHLDFYKDGMYAPLDIEGQEYYLKPMNCPFHTEIYSSSKRSYRDLPLRFAEWGTVYRFERSGTLHGLTRVRGFTQDDAHLFCRGDQMPEEIDKVLSFSLDMLRDFGFEDFKLFLSTRPEKHVGAEENWDASEQALREALERSGIEFQVNEGDGAFYGPKIDIYVSDALGRGWQLSTIQFDFNLPERFNLTYVGEDGKEHRPYMIHRALLGSMERFFGVLTEHFGGAFPTWLAPVQVSVLPISERHEDYTNSVLEKLKAAGIRAETDTSSNTLNYRIRAAQKMKIPLMLIAGDREREENTVSLRLRSGDDAGAKSVQEIISVVQTAVREKSDKALE